MDEQTGGGAAFTGGCLLPPWDEAKIGHAVRDEMDIALRGGHTICAACPFGRNIAETVIRHDARNGFAGFIFAHVVQRPFGNEDASAKRWFAE